LGVGRFFRGPQMPFALGRLSGIDEVRGPFVRLWLWHLCKGESNLESMDYNIW